MALSKPARWALTGATSLAAIVGGIGLLHMPFAKPLLMKIGGCPVGNVAPAEVEAARNDAIRSTRGEGAAAARPALGFTLDEMTLDRVKAWADASKVSCDEKREGTVLICKDVPAAAFAGNASGNGTLDDVTFGFTVTGKRLVNVTTLRSNLDAADASARMGVIASSLEQSLGAPTTRVGAFTPESFRDQAFATSTVAYRFQDYMADVTGTAIPGRGVVLREHYMSARL